MPIDYAIIANNVRKYRLQRKISQEQLAELSGTSTPHISHIETNNTKVSLPLLINIAYALKVTVNDLILPRCYQYK